MRLLTIIALFLAVSASIAEYRYGKIPEDEIRNQLKAREEHARRVLQQGRTINNLQFNRRVIEKKVLDELFRPALAMDALDKNIKRACAFLSFSCFCCCFALFIFRKKDTDTEDEGEIEGSENELEESEYEVDDSTPYINQDDLDTDEESEDTESSEGELDGSDEEQEKDEHTKNVEKMWQLHPRIMERLKADPPIGPDGKPSYYIQDTVRRYLVIREEILKEDQDEESAISESSEGESDEEWGNEEVSEEQPKESKLRRTRSLRELRFEDGKEIHQASGDSDEESDDSHEESEDEEVIENPPKTSDAPVDKSTKSDITQQDLDELRRSGNAFLLALQKSVDNTFVL